MNATRLLSTYEQISEAPNAIARLRRFVLDLAVRGKLVEQDPVDEPASTLLARIVEKKKRIMKARKTTQRTVDLLTISTEPFELPSSWEWAPLGTVFIYDAGIKRNPQDLKPSLWLLELEDIEKETGQLLQRVCVTDRDSKSTKSEFQMSDILYGKLRPYLSKVLVADCIGYSTTEIVAIRPVIPLNSEFCAHALRRSDFVKYVTRLGQGTKMPRLRTQDAIVAPFPLPPLAEQHRIVAKINELMALCDRLEGARATRESTRDKLTVASFTRLTAADTNESNFPTYARFALNALPALTALANQIKILRKTILNLAVRGRLMEQGPADEPASELLKRIAEEKARLVSSGQLRKTKPLPSVDQPPYNLPPSWCWTRIREVTSDRGQQVPKTKFTYIDVTAIDKESGIVSDPRVLSPTAAPSRARKITRRGDVIYSCVRPYLLNVAVIEKEFEPAPIVSTAFAVLNGHSLILPWYLWIVLRSPFMVGCVKENQRGQAYPAINESDFANLPIPLPPLIEQERIVEKVNELMILCNQLEKAVDAADTTRTCFLKAILYEALNSPLTHRIDEA